MAEGCSETSSLLVGDLEDGNGEMTGREDAMMPRLSPSLDRMYGAGKIVCVVLAAHGHDANASSATDSSARNGGTKMAQHDDLNTTPTRAATRLWCM